MKRVFVSKFPAVICIALAFANSAQALETAMPAALSLESVPPSSFTKQTETLETTRQDSMVLASLINESDTPKYRPIIVVRLQRSEPIIDQTDENSLAQQSDVDWESRRRDRLARFMELAARNAAPQAAAQLEPRQVRFETGPRMNVFASNDGYSLGWPLHY